MSNFDTLFDALLSRSVGLDTLSQFSRPMASFPPYNIVRVDDDVTEIHVAAAGYGPEDLCIFERNGVLHIESDGGSSEEDEMIYRGIAKRSFKRTFALGADITVQGAACNNGMVVVRLVRSVVDDKLITIDESLPALGPPTDTKVLDFEEVKSA